MTKAEKNRTRNRFKDEILQKQGGLCALCGKGEWETSSKPGDWGERSKSKIQKVNYLDHNHSHVGCNGCKLCARGMVHNFCNRAISLLEKNEHLQSDFVREYIARGKV